MELIEELRTVVDAGFKGRVETELGAKLDVDIEAEGVVEGGPTDVTWEELEAPGAVDWNPEGPDVPDESTFDEIIGDTVISELEVITGPVDIPAVPNFEISIELDEVKIGESFT